MGMLNATRGVAIGTGAYSLRDAALILRIPFAKLRRWAAGYWYAAVDEDRFSNPVVPGFVDEMEERILSFTELVELGVIGYFRDQGVSMQVVRAARNRAQKIFKSEYPFATERVRTDGSGIFSDLPLVDDVAPKRFGLELSMGQIAIRDFVEPFFRKNLDFAEDGLVSAYWPLGREKAVVLDARRSFGRPIIRESGTPTFMLYQLKEAGENLDRIAAWYQIPRVDVEAAIEFEETLRNVA